MFQKIFENFHYISFKIVHLFSRYCDRFVISNIPNSVSGDLNKFEALFDIFDRIKIMTCLILKTKFLLASLNLNLLKVSVFVNFVH